MCQQTGDPRDDPGSADLAHACCGVVGHVLVEPRPGALYRRPLVTASGSGRYVYSVPMGHSGYFGSSAVVVVVVVVVVVGCLPRPVGARHLH